MIRPQRQQDNGVALQSADQAGFSLVESMLAMLIIMLVLLSVAQLFGVGVQVGKAAEDITQVTSLAGEKIEQLKYLPYDTLIAGGSLDADLAGYADQPDVDVDGIADFTRRWAVTDLGGSKQIEVRVIGTAGVGGGTKETTVGVLVAR